MLDLAASTALLRPGHESPTAADLGCAHSGLIAQARVRASASLQPSKLELWLLWVRAAAVLNDDAGGVGASLAALGDGLALREGGQEATDVGVAGAVGVNKLLLGQRSDGVLRHLAVDAHDRRVLALRDDYRALPLLLPRDQREPRGDEGHVLGLPACLLRPRLSLRLVAKEEVDEGHVLGLPA